MANLIAMLEASPPTGTKLLRALGMSSLYQLSRNPTARRDYSLCMHCLVPIALTLFLLRPGAQAAGVGHAARGGGARDHAVAPRLLRTRGGQDGPAGRGAAGPHGRAASPDRTLRPALHFATIL
jgi:hypothetical protein